MRENCRYILHSSGQLSSHKRKHERFDNGELPQPAKKPKNETESDDSNERDLFSILNLMKSKTPDEEPLNLVKNGEEAKSMNNTVIKEEVKEVTTQKAQPVQSVSTVENFFSRKRGRPPKNRFVQVYDVSFIMSIDYMLH